MRRRLLELLVRMSALLLILPALAAGASPTAEADFTSTVERAALGALGLLGTLVLWFGRGYVTRLERLEGAAVKRDDCNRCQVSTVQAINRLAEAQESMADAQQRSFKEIADLKICMVRENPNIQFER